MAEKTKKSKEDKEMMMMKAKKGGWESSLKGNANQRSDTGVALPMKLFY